MGINLRFAVNISVSRPSILKVQVFDFPHKEMCFNAKQSGFPVQLDEKIRNNRVFWSTYKESCYHTFDNSVVHHIRCLPRNLNGIFSSQMVKRSMGEPFWKGRLNGLIRLVHNKRGFFVQRSLHSSAPNWFWNHWKDILVSRKWNPSPRLVLEKIILMVLSSTFVWVYSRVQVINTG